ncbi:PEP-CTERM sorting domain-containing protein [Paucibacter sp. DJ2R-2]|uniref:PEP-CTERM sorting domain-containing protein n=1 Tax=Paucibacter sp. DJ2R-2 TaxID=2893558 RepID=UPI0021E41681|nr:PEP-CTERM sorting domain-containing protein [Paucibacter sp. DJ2R-2]MCV2438715.1 PEP-CTERM sorting domain-containing protein [Paucibacter sp. DJ2R-2]
MKQSALNKAYAASSAIILSAAALAASPAQAVTVADPMGDFLSTYKGAQTGEFDVIASWVNYDADRDVFELSATMAGNISPTSLAAYVWGFNRGQGTAGFGNSLGLTQVLFDRTVVVNANGSIISGGVNVGAATIFGSTISATIAGSVLPENGFSKANYTWNLWPRFTGNSFNGVSVSGVSAIPDFAPNAVNAAVTAVPEPSTTALMFLGLGAFALLRRRAQR